ncbi:MAG: hypothetical protein GY891_07235 [Bacteroidetes bacterium]|nr:hypothetical protein [Bacteroidota bacterium]
MKQSYIEIFENTGGNITVKYAMPAEDQTLEIQTIEFKQDDLAEIAHHFLYLSELGEE